MDYEKNTNFSVSFSSEKLADDIYFYNKSSEFGFMSNFYPIRFNQFNCSEQAFMFYKCLTFDSTNKELLKAILDETEPNKIKSLGRGVRNYDDQVWNNKRYDVMVNVLIMKFGETKLMETLIKTGNVMIYEASPTDAIWGIGYAKNNLPTSKEVYGKNLLGKALMEVRNLLQQVKK
jgi:ribA/ribD-fused uncharacterized protein